MKRLFFLMIAAMLCGLGVSAKTIIGTVYDAVNNEPLIGASVLPIGGGQGVATDVDGNFSITVPDNVKTAKISYVGYTPQVVELKNGMNVYLSSSASNLDDLVVVAYGQQKKSAVTGSVSQVNADKIAERPTSSVISALEGTTSGLNVTGNYGEAGTAPSITIRGIGTVNGSNSPLYVIDGMPVGTDKSVMNDMNPDDVESISILKDAASAALYGNRASNGVVLITTKKAKTSDKIAVNFKFTQGWYERAIPEYSRLGAQDWMEAQFLNFRNAAYISKESGFNWNNVEQMQAANAYAKSNFVSQWIYNSPFDVNPNVAGQDYLFTDDGKFNRSLGMLGTYAEDLDWWDQAIRKGSRGEYSMSVRGATNKSDYSFSLSYLSEDGYMRDNSYDRITGFAKINATPAKWMKTGLSINASHQKTSGTMNGVGDGNTSFNNAFYVCRYISPIYPVHLHNVNTGEYLLNSEGGLRFDPGWYNEATENGNMQEVVTRNQFSNRNVIWESEVNRRQTIRNTMNATAYMDINLPYGIVATVKGNLYTRNRDGYDYSSAEIGDAYQEGALSKTIYTYKTYTFSQQLNWNYTFEGKHNLNVLLAHENYSYHYDYTYTSKRGQAFEGIAALSNFSEMKNVSGYRTGYNQESYLGRVQYNFDDRYNLEASFRRDGSSRFAKDTRWGNFGSVGANWVFSNEAFVRNNVSWISSGKIFANWGQVGNDASAGYYASLPLMGSTTNDQLPAYYLLQLAATDLKWETSEATGIGIEANLFNRWNVSLEYYNKTNKDLIFAVNLPSSAGPDGWAHPDSGSTNHPTIDKNIGSIRNRGLEISTDVDIVRTKDWKVNVGTNFSFNSNKITKLPDENKYLIGYDQKGNALWENGYMSGSYKIAEGHSRYEFFTYHWEGVDQMTGRSLYTPDLQNYYIKQADGTILGGTYMKNDSGDLVLDTSKSQELAAANYVLINGKYYVYNPTYGERNWRGSTLPKVNGSFNASASYKGISLSVLFTYALGGKILDSNYQSLMTAGNTPSAFASDILTSWNGIPAGMTETSADRISTGIAPNINYSDSYANSSCDRWLISRNYLCFKNINVAYSLPKSFLRQFGLSDVKVNFQAENLFFSTKRKGLSPQLGNNGTQGNYLVPARVFTFGLNVNI